MNIPAFDGLVELAADPTGEEVPEARKLLQKQYRPWFRRAIRLRQLRNHNIPLGDHDPGDDDKSSPESE